MNEWIYWDHNTYWQSYKAGLQKKGKQNKNKEYVDEVSV